MMHQSLLKLLKGECADKIVWTADITYWLNGQSKMGKANSAWETEQGYLELCQELGIMPYYSNGKFWLAEPVYDDTVRMSTQTENTRTVRKWQTPVGTLCEESNYMTKSFSTACTRYPVQTKEDLKTLLYVLEHRRLKPACLDDYHQRLKLWQRYDGMPSVALPRSPLPAFFCEWAGVENSVYLIMDYPELISEIFKLMESQEQVIIDAVCDCKPLLVHFADNLSSETFTGFFDKFMAEHYTKRLSCLHAAGIPCAVHLDGTVRGLLPKLAEIGFDAIEALTPQPAGDIALEDMRSIANNDNVILWGGVPGAMFSTPYTWDDMELHLQKLLNSWKGSRFVVGVADQVPPDGNIQWCKKIAGLIKKYEKGMKELKLRTRSNSCF